MSAASSKLIRICLIATAALAVFASSALVGQILLIETSRSRQKALNEIRENSTTSRAFAIKTVLESLADRLRLYGASLLRIPNEPIKKQKTSSPPSMPLSPPPLPELENEKTILFLSVIFLNETPLKIKTQATNALLATQMGFKPEAFQEHHQKLLRRLNKEGPNFLDSSRLDGEIPILTFATPLETDLEGKPIKALLATFQTDMLSTLLPTENNWELSILEDQRGKLIAHPNPRETHSPKPTAIATSVKPIEIANLQVRTVSNEKYWGELKTQAHEKLIVVSIGASLILSILLFFLTGGKNQPHPGVPAVQKENEKTGLRFVEKLTPKPNKTDNTQTQVTYVLDPQTKAQAHLAKTTTPLAPPTPPPFKVQPEPQITLDPPILAATLAEPKKSDPTSGNSGGSSSSAA